MSQRTSDLKTTPRRFGRGSDERAFVQESQAERNLGGSRKERGEGDYPPEVRPVCAALESSTAPENDDLVVAAPNAEEHAGSLSRRLSKIEKQNFRLKLSMAALVLLVAYIAFGQTITDNIIVKQTLLESKELKLLDNEGNARLFLRMYSRVPVLQLLDSNGKPRMSLGMRFDDTPFIDLSDRTGRTRATLEMTGTDEPSLRLFDAKGEPTFIIN